MFKSFRPRPKSQPEGPPQLLLSLGEQLLVAEVAQELQFRPLPPQPRRSPCNMPVVPYKPIFSRPHYMLATGATTRAMTLHTASTSGRRRTGTNTRWCEDLALVLSPLLLPNFWCLQRLDKPLGGSVVVAPLT